MNKAITTTTALALREEIDRRQDSAFKAGTVIRWNRTFEANPWGDRSRAKTYTYAALFTGGLWWLTGRETGGIKTDDLIDNHLAEATRIVVAGAWRSV